MNAKSILRAAISKWNAIAETNEGLNPISIEEVEAEGEILIRISKGPYVQSFSYKGHQNKESMKQYAYEMLLEQCLFCLMMQPQIGIK